ncbi:DUF2938 domain-containing protein [Pseudoalteromonas sp. T1lg65]|uniref:DUF2938 domain-containing protein n=1 Tax=Pseudoalteromonas sp. T1lg65 TaxID=2077101 RepID=UPI003F795707
MSESIKSLPELIKLSILFGLSATFVMDLWGALLKYAFNMTGLNCAFVGRWLGHLFKGTVMHNHIAQSKMIRGEVIWGWFAHYLIGTAFAGIFVWLVGCQWLLEPSLLPALAMGFVTLAAPLFILQPCFGLGIAANKTPTPNIVRAKSLIAHIAFGVGLYVSGLVYAF